MDSGAPLLAVSLATFCCISSSAAPALEKKTTLTVRTIGETGWRTAVDPPGFPLIDRPGGGYRWARDGVDRSGPRYREVIEILTSVKDWTQHGKEFNAHCLYGPDRPLEFTEGSHYGKRSYGWVCVQRAPGMLTYEGHYELAVNVPYYNTIMIHYIATIRGSSIDSSRFPFNDRTLPGLVSYRSFKATLAPIDPTVGEERAPGVVPLLR